MLDLALDNRVFLYSEIDCAIQEIDLLLNTQNTEVLGDISFGVEIERFLWSLTPAITSLESYIRETIEKNTIYAKNFNVTVNVNFMQGEYRSIYSVKISLIDPTTKEKRERNYRFQ